MISSFRNLGGTQTRMHRPRTARFCSSARSPSVSVRDVDPLKIGQGAARKRAERRPPHGRKTCDRKGVNRAGPTPQNTGRSVTREGSGERKACFQFTTIQKPVMKFWRYIWMISL